MHITRLAEMFKEISIHALREEGDHCRLRSLSLGHNFYPRPPRGGRPTIWRLHPQGHLFLSTPSARRATLLTRNWISPYTISIHALREEGDFAMSSSCNVVFLFLSTPSARRATMASLSHRLFRRNFYPRPPRGGRPEERGEFAVLVAISIHALREEGDDSSDDTCKDLQDFYPRPPRGGRRKTTEATKVTEVFLSTPSARRATANLGEQAILKKISIHALREEGDANDIEMEQIRRNFYPRPPRGGRPRFYRNAAYASDFYPRPPRGGRLSRFLRTRQCTGISIHALREEGDKLRSATLSSRSVFLSTPSARRATRTHRRLRRSKGISIHALREEGDAPDLGGGIQDFTISIHALREEGD